MKLDISKIDDKAIAELNALVKNADSQNDSVSDDIIEAIYGDDTEGLRKYRESVSATSGEKESLIVKDVAKAVAKSRGRRKKLGSLPDPKPEKDDPNILIRGAWLERGGSAFIVSTAGTGKSIWVTQFAISLMHGVPFSGLQSYQPLKFWLIQSEDSDRRVAIDRNDISDGLAEMWADHAEFSKIDWRKTADNLETVDFTGLTGPAFLEQLRIELAAAKEDGDRPDVIIISPFMDYLGADPSSNPDVMAFLSGGLLATKRTEGLRSIIRDFNVGVLIVHHTGKPPSSKELAAWITSSLPEYQACGASYTTNWGRSFITMMKIPDMEGFVMLTAGKNGGGLGWPTVEGARRIFLKHGEGDSCGGSGRKHLWMNVDGYEYQECVEAVANLCKNGKKKSEDGEVANNDEENARRIAEVLAKRPTVRSVVGDVIVSELHLMSHRTFRTAFKFLCDNGERFGISYEKVGDESKRGPKTTVMKSSGVFAQSQDSGGDADDERWYDR